MKKIITLILCFSFLLSCKNDKTETIEAENTVSKSYDQNDGYVTIKGDFIYDKSQNAAVIQSANNQIYGVVIDDNMKALNEKVLPFKKEATDMIPVTVRAKRIAKPEGEEGWPFRLEIKETIKVEAPNPEQNDVIKIEN
ncbi:hypothetical protein ACFQ1Q_05665 [Winogradskyella litorisediminis]|uniref:Lipoprotein n=1 Tax=Winogradskyella litorisediminis TaxID=1156618 RepID=A0ABW3N903_9FLAO